MAVHESFQPHHNDGREEDLKILSQWVRKELFVKVKFLYDVKEDLAVNENIYNHFVREDCKLKLLLGLKLNADQPSEYRRKHVESLWKGQKEEVELSDRWNQR